MTDVTITGSEFAYAGFIERPIEYWNTRWETISKQMWQNVTSFEHDTEGRDK